MNTPPPTPPVKPLTVTLQFSPAVYASLQLAADERHVSVPSMLKTHVFDAWQRGEATLLLVKVTQPVPLFSAAQVAVEALPGAVEAPAPAVTPAPLARLEAAAAAAPEAASKAPEKPVQEEIVWTASDESDDPNASE